MHGQLAGLSESGSKLPHIQSMLLPASAGSTPTRRTSTKPPEASAASPKTTSTPAARPPRPMPPENKENQEQWA